MVAFVWGFDCILLLLWNGQDANARCSFKGDDKQYYLS